MKSSLLLVILILAQGTYMVAGNENKPNIDSLQLQNTTSDNNHPSLATIVQKETGNPNALKKTEKRDEVGVKDILAICVFIGATMYLVHDLTH